MLKNNIFSGLPKASGEEILETLVRTPGVEIERIVSCGQVSPPGFWYDQERDEWVLLLAGSAALRFEEGDELVELMPGDHVLIPAHARHRVERTDPEGRTCWLAVFFAPAG